MEKIESTGYPILPESRHRTSNPTITSPIHSIPPELLIKIFSFHVLHNYRNPVSLLLICRTWTSTALNTGKLWSRIMYGAVNINNLAMDICEDIEGSLHCMDPFSLAKAIQRSGKVKFTLALGRVPSNQDTEREWSSGHILDAAWFRTRCQSLRLLEDYVPPHLSSMFEDLSALEELVCSRMLLTWNPGHDQILAVANHTSHNLKSLSYRGFLDIRKYEKLLRRLRVLELPSHMIGGIVQFAMDHLENGWELSLVGNQFQDMNPCHYDLPPTLQQLTISHEDLSIHSSNFTNLTHLVLRCCSINNGSMTMCPALTDLTFIYPRECMIGAPNLKRLTILGGILVSEPCLIWSHLRPITLQIDAVCLQGYRAGDFTPLCSRVQECTVICNVPGMIAVERASILFDDTDGVSSCPNLQRLSFICPHEEGESAFERTMLKDRLVGLASGLRRSVSFQRLEQVKFGWYQVVKRKRHTVEHAWRRWWDIEWQTLVPNGEQGPNARAHTA